jgi:hypothetical protein
MIELKLLDKIQLEDFINSTEFKNLPSIPISRHRALSQIKNPRADSKDVLLIVAYCGTEIVGYLGTIPDAIFISEKEYKCAVLSCIWVKPELRKGDVSMNLLKKSHDLYKWIFGSDYVPATIKMYNRSGFFSHEMKVGGVRVYMRMDLHSILPPKKKFFKRIKPILLIGDKIANSLLDIRFKLFTNRLKTECFEYVKEVDDETSEFIGKLQEKQLFRRNREELNWIINNPWILTDPADNDPRYYFTSVENSFDYFCIKVRGHQNELIAFLILSKRNLVMKVPYCYLKADALETVVRILVHHIYKWKINTFVSHHPQLSQYFLKRNIGELFKKKGFRIYFFSKELHRIINNAEFQMQDGDADSAFI